MLQRAKLPVCSSTAPCLVGKGECARKVGDEGFWLTHPEYYNIAKSTCGDSDTALDIVAKAYNEIRTKPLKRGDSFCSLMRISVFRRAMDFVRQRNRRLEVPEVTEAAHKIPVDPAVRAEIQQLIVGLRQACADKYSKGNGELFVDYSMADEHGQKMKIAHEYGLSLSAASNRVRRIKNRGIEEFAAEWLRLQGYSVEELARLLRECSEERDA